MKQNKGSQIWAMIIKIFMEERCTYLAVLPKFTNLQSILSDGWSGNLSADVKFMDQIRILGGILVKFIAEFDDIDVGIICIGGSEVISEFN